MRDWKEGKDGGIKKRAGKEMNEISVHIRDE